MYVRTYTNMYIKLTYTNMYIKRTYTNMYIKWQNLTETEEQNSQKNIKIY